MTEIDTTTAHQDGLFTAYHCHESRSTYDTDGYSLNIEWSPLNICHVTVRLRRLYHAAARARPQTMTTRTKDRVC